MPAQETMMDMLEKLLYACRWLLAPIYFGLSLGLLALTVKFFQELYHFIPQVLVVEETDLMLRLLTLIDLSMVASLIVIVTFSGYENFVSQISIDQDTEKLEWLGKHDYGSLKMKVASTIVAISSIHLLKVFMNIQATDNDKLVWYMLIHLTLVMSAFLMGFLEKLTKHT